MSPQKYPVKPRVKQVLLMLAKGHQEPYIAHKLSLSLSTVASYITDARQQYRLGETHVEMVRNALDRGLISAQEVEAI